MTLGGKSAFDNQENILDLGATLLIQKNLRVNGTITSAGGGELLANDEYLQARNSTDSADLDLLKADATNATVLNASVTGKLAVAGTAILTWAAGLVAPVVTNAIALGSASLGFAGLFLSIGKTIHLKVTGTPGAAEVAGTVVVNGVTPVAIATTAFTADSVVSFSLKTVGGTVGQIPHLVTATPSTGFTVAATASDTSTYNWAIIEIA